MNATTAGTVPKADPTPKKAAARRDSQIDVFLFDRRCRILTVPVTAGEARHLIESALAVPVARNAAQLLGDVRLEEHVQLAGRNRIEFSNHVERVLTPGALSPNELRMAPRAIRPEEPLFVPLVMHVLHNPDRPPEWHEQVTKTEQQGFLYTFAANGRLLTQPATFKDGQLTEPGCVDPERAERLIRSGAAIRLTRNAVRFLRNDEDPDYEPDRLEMQLRELVRVDGPVTAPLRGDPSNVARTIHGITSLNRGDLVYVFDQEGRILVDSGTDAGTATQLVRKQRAARLCANAIQVHKAITRGTATTDPVGQIPRGGLEPEELCGLLPGTAPLSGPFATETIRNIELWNGSAEPVPYVGSLMGTVGEITDPAHQPIRNRRLERRKPADGNRPVVDWRHGTPPKGVRVTALRDNPEAKTALRRINRGNTKAYLARLTPRERNQTVGMLHRLDTHALTRGRIDVTAALSRHEAAGDFLRRYDPQRGVPAAPDPAKQAVRQRFAAQYGGHQIKKIRGDNPPQEPPRASVWVFDGEGRAMPLRIHTAAAQRLVRNGGASWLASPQRRCRRCRTVFGDSPACPNCQHTRSQLVAPALCSCCFRARYEGEACPGCGKTRTGVVTLAIMLRHCSAPFVDEIARQHGSQVRVPQQLMDALRGAGLLPAPASARAHAPDRAPEGSDMPADGQTAGRKPDRALARERVDEAMALVPALVRRTASLQDVRRFRLTALRLLGCRSVAEVDGAPRERWLGMLRLLTGAREEEQLDPATVVAVRTAIRQPMRVARLVDEADAN